jgi:glycosyltransferase involved in cell wall biosynthesis
MAEQITFSMIIPTISRPTLARTLQSLVGQKWIEGDEVLLVGDGSQPVAGELWEQFRLPGRFVEVAGPSNDWGHNPRNVIHKQAKGRFLLALDDDDELIAGAVNLVRSILADNPERPHLFRMSGAPNLGELWKVQDIREGNVGTPMFVPPNVAGKLGKYAPFYGGDCEFIRETCRHYPDGPIWRTEFICKVRPFRRGG